MKPFELFTGLQIEKLRENYGDTEAPPVVELEIKSLGIKYLLNGIQSFQLRVAYGFSSDNLRRRQIDVQRILDEAERNNDEVQNDLRFYAQQPLPIYRAVAKEIGMFNGGTDERSAEFRAVVKAIEKNNPKL